jgi:DNA-binding NtrC family response regulator
MALILVVEDERSIRQAIYFELVDEGYDVHSASSYREAESALKAFDYDLVISDIFLDDGNGVQLMEFARKMNKQSPFIVISAFPDSDLALQVKQVLNDRFFEKPFFAEDLKEKACEILKESMGDSGSLGQTAFCH